MTGVIKGHVFISPHSDDVAFSLGCALLEGRFGPGIIVTVFSITNCTIYDQYDDIGYVSGLRKKEDESFFITAKVQLEKIYLDRLDVPLRLGICDEHVFDTVPAVNDDKEMEYLYTEISSMHKPAGILFAPLGLGGHLDHVLVHKVACNFAREGWSTAFYEDLPYADRMEPENIERIVKDTQIKIGRPLKAFDIKSCSGANRKGQAIRVYRSQIDQPMVEEIINYGMRFDANLFVERVWCDPAAFKQLNEYHRPHV